MKDVLILTQQYEAIQTGKDQTLVEVFRRRLLRLTHVRAIAKHYRQRERTALEESLDNSFTATAVPMLLHWKQYLQEVNDFFATRESTRRNNLEEAARSRVAVENIVVNMMAEVNDLLDESKKRKRDE